jgi:putative endonuclease
MLFPALCTAAREASIGEGIFRRCAPASTLRDMTRWCVYLLLCRDGSLYAGATNDLSARLAKHRSGRGARYTRGRGPLALAFCEPAADRGAALRRERQLKRLHRKQKLRLVGKLA